MCSVHGRHIVTKSLTSKQGDSSRLCAVRFARTAVIIAVHACGPARRLSSGTYVQTVAFIRRPAVSSRLCRVKTSHVSDRVIVLPSGDVHTTRLAASGIENVIHRDDSPLKAFKYVAPQMTLSVKYLQLQPMYILSVYSVIHSGHSALQAETAIVKQPLLHDTMATLD